MVIAKSTNKVAVTAKYSAGFAEEMNTILKADKIRLERELAKFAKPNPHTVEKDFDTRFPNFGDKEDENAAEVAEYAANLTIEQDLEKALRDVLGALDRIKKGGYGICKYCKKPIDEKRLRARPDAGTCVECKKAITQEI